MKLSADRIIAVLYYVAADREDYGRNQALVSERDSLITDCPDCGAARHQLCYSPTGLPSSLPCPSRRAKAAA